MDLELELFGDLKDKSGCTSALGKVYMLSLSSQPVDHEDASGERQKVRNFPMRLSKLFIPLLKKRGLKSSGIVVLEQYRF